MTRKFLSVFIALFVLFVSQSQVFAATKQVDDTQKTMANYTYTMNNTQTVLDEEVQAPYQLAARKAKANVDMSEYIWIASIFVAGLGQILMGDVEGGIWWMIKVYALPIIFGILMAVLTTIFVTTSYTTGSIGLAGIVGLVGTLGYLVVGIISLIFYVMNIIDAYNMSQGRVSAIQIQEKFAQLENMQKFAENVSLRDGNISYKVLAF